jgi:predicted nucleic acid-binding Zn ribbon protein
MKRRPAPEICPVCGEDVPRNALACPECGADYNSGWKDDAAVYDALDLPDDSFDDGEFINEESQGSRKPGIKLVWWITGILVLVAFVVLYFYGAR